MTAKQVACFLLGTLSLVLGAIGVFLPLLPTTPLLLLAAACYLRSSDTLHDWLINHRLFGPYIRNYRDHKAIAKQHRTNALILLWVTISLTSCLAVENWWLRGFLLIVGVSVSLHLIRLKTIPPQPENDLSS